MTIRTRNHTHDIALAIFTSFLALAGCSGSDSASNGASGSGGGSSGSSTTAASSGTAGGSSASGNGGAGGTSGTSSNSTGTGGGSSTGTGGSGGTAGVDIDTTPGIYRETCDGSAGIFIDHDHFLDANDENQVLRLYKRGQDAGPIQTFQISSAIGLANSDEADLEGATLLGNRAYWISSHGRTKNGVLELTRYRFFATDVAGVVPNVQLTPIGYTDTLLHEMVKSSNWITPDSAVITLLSDRSLLSMGTVPDLAPKINGTAIEGLAAVPTALQPERLLIGFRNPQYQSKAIVVSLLNPNAVLTQMIKPSFGEAILLDLNGLGIRAMTYSPFHNAVLVIGGPIPDGGPFKLYKWTGNAADPAVYVQDITVPVDSNPEAIVVFPDSRFIQVLLDQGSLTTNGTQCKDMSTGSQKFTDLIFKVD